MPRSVPWPTTENADITNIEEIVSTYGRDWLKAFLKEIRSKTTDPLASLWTPDNWRCWLNADRYVYFLGHTLHELAFHGTEPPSPFDEDIELATQIFYCVVACLPWEGLVMTLRNQYLVIEMHRCARAECVFSKEGNAKRKRVKLKVCKGCGDTRYCGRECQRRDWLDPEGHKRLCGKRLMITPSSSRESVGSADTEPA